MQALSTFLKTLITLTTSILEDGMCLSSHTRKPHVFDHWLWLGKSIATWNFWPQPWSQLPLISWSSSEFIHWQTVHGSTHKHAFKGSLSMSSLGWWKKGALLWKYNVPSESLQEYIFRNYHPSITLDMFMFVGLSVTGVIVWWVNKAYTFDVYYILLSCHVLLNHKINKFHLHFNKHACINICSV